MKNDKNVFLFSQLYTTEKKILHTSNDQLKRKSIQWPFIHAP